MAGINLASGFNRTTAQPLDLYDVVVDATARDAIGAGYRYEGMKVYVVADQMTYVLKGGITNGDWAEDGGGGGGPFVNFAQTTLTGVATESALAVASSFVIMDGITTLLQGIAGPAPGESPMLILTNRQGSDDIVCQHLNGAAGINKIYTGPLGINHKIKYGESAIFLYDDTNNSWMLIGGAPGSGGGGVGPINRTTNIALTLGGYIAIDTALTEQTVYVSGNTAATDLDQYQPFGTQQPAIDGSTVTVIGADDTKTIRLQNGDIGQWAAVGPFSELTFAKYYSATFKFDVLNEKWVLIGKNF